MKTALVFIEFKDGDIKKSSAEALSVFLGSSYSIATCAVGAGSENLGEALGRWGVKQHFCCPDLTQFNPTTYQQFFAQVFQQVKPEFFVGSSNNHGRDVFPRLGAQFDAAYMSDVTEITVEPQLTVKRPLYAGKCMAEVSFTDASPKILLFRPNQIPVKKATESVKTELVKVALPAAQATSETVSIEAGESEKLDLTEAEIVVSGGRGLKDAENFKILNDLAEPINATVGASRAVVDLGWVPHSLQVGQTGKTVAPNLYIAVGISGAIQHLAGMSGSKTIVAINKDDKAPIFQKATYGLVGDLFEIVPLLAAKLKSIH